MISNPEYGWCHVQIGEWSTHSASYLEDYPEGLADAFLLAAGKDLMSDYDIPLSDRLTPIIDCEGTRYAVEILPGEEIRIWDEEVGYGGAPIYAMFLSEGRLSKLCHELAGDILGDLDTWTLWNSIVDGDVEESGGDAESCQSFLEHRACLKMLCGALLEV